MTTFASGGSHGLTYVAEPQFGNPGATPTMKALRHTSCGLVLSKDSFQSNELRNDRQISDLRHGAIRAGGDIGIEFSYGEFDALLEGALFGDWEANVLKAGTKEKSFTFQRAFTDIGQYGIFKGCMISGFSLNIPANAMITGSFSVVGKEAEYKNTPIVGTAATPSQTFSPFDSFSGALKEGGANVAVITSIDLGLDNRLEPVFVVGSKFTPKIVAGRSNLTGSVSAYFQDGAMLDKFINETESSIEFIFGPMTGGGEPGPNSYKFTIPRLKYSGGDNPASGEGPIVLNMPFQGLLDSVSGTNLIIERIPA